jgi:hypothetical protein
MTILQRAERSRTKLMAYFETNQTDPHACSLLYVEFPEHFVWKASSRTWSPCQCDFSIGHLHFAPPSSGERLYLRTLLTVVRGARSFEELRSFDGVEYSTYKEACLACGLLEDDQEWRLCLQEAGGIQSGSQLRWLFTTILAFCSPSDPRNLWNLFKHLICDDLKHRLQTRYHMQSPEDDQVNDFGLYLIDKILTRLANPWISLEIYPR